KKTLSVFVRRGPQEADGARRILRYAEACSVEPREGDPCAGPALLRRGLEVVQDPSIVREKQSLDPMVIEDLEEPLRRLAERRSLTDQYGHRLADAALPQERGADRVIVAVSSKFREFVPQPRPIVSERLLDCRTLGRPTRAPAKRGLPQLAERQLGLVDALVGRAGRPHDRQREIAIDADTHRV